MSRREMCLLLTGVMVNSSVAARRVVNDSDLV